MKYILFVLPFGLAINSKLVSWMGSVIMWYYKKDKLWYFNIPFCLLFSHFIMLKNQFCRSKV